MSNPNASIGRLVVVDDEPSILDVFRAIFSAEPWAVTYCATGTEALQAFGDGGVDVLLTDKNLPDVGGFELIEAARGCQPDAQAIVITGYASLDTALEAIALDVFDYIVKPPRDIFDVRRKVRQAFERQALERQNQALVLQLQRRNEELEEALSALRDAQAEIVRSETLAGLGTLAAGVAHEISSPLFGIMGLAEAISEEEDLAEVQSYATEIVTYSRQIRDIIAQLTHTPRSSPALEDVSVAGAVRAAVRLVEHLPDLQCERVEVEVAEDLHVRAVSDELIGVMVNLLKNALQATPLPGRVQVRATATASTVQIVVEDEGPGVPAADRDRVFEPFFTTKAPGQGTGLGLNLVFRMLERWGATIRLDDAPGGGARFMLSFQRGGTA